MKDLTNLVFSRWIEFIDFDMINCGLESLSKIEQMFKQRLHSV